MTTYSVDVKDEPVGTRYVSDDRHAAELLELRIHDLNQAKFRGVESVRRQPLKDLRTLRRQERMRHGGAGD